MCNLIACIQATRQHYSNFSNKDDLKFTKKYISCEKWKVALEMLNQAWGVVIYLVIRWVFNPISRGISGLNRVIRSKLWALCFITADFNKGGPSVKTAWFVWALRFFTINFLLFDFFAFLPVRLFQPLLLLVMGVISIFLVLVKSPIYQIKT